MAGKLAQQKCCVPLFRVGSKSITNLFQLERALSHVTFPVNAPLAQKKPKDLYVPETNVTSSFGNFIANAKPSDLSETVKERSKRMMLDTFGNGLIGSTTDIAKAVQQHVTHLSAIDGDTVRGSSFWGKDTKKVSPVGAAFANGVAIHSMDFDDTWHPATHPSGPVLPTVLALTEAMAFSHKPSGEDILLAYNIGIEVQGMLMRCSMGARQIPHRFHPPAVVGVMGSAAAAAKLLRFGPEKSLHALAIAASFAGAPMANAGTNAKPLHVGNSARFGLEAAFLADADIQGNVDILEKESGFPAFYEDYRPTDVAELQKNGWCLGNQDIAIKRIPAHLGMHWTMDAAQNVRRMYSNEHGKINFNDIKEIIIAAPNSKYVNRPIPEDEHAARHSFQFIACSTILDGGINPESFTDENLQRPALQSLLSKTRTVIPPDNDPNFDKMYVGIAITTKNNDVISAKCDTFYGHWRKPLSDPDLQAKFKRNAAACNLEKSSVDKIIDIVNNIENCDAHTIKELIPNLSNVQGGHDRSWSYQ